MRFQDILTAVMVAEHTMFLKLVLSGTLYVLAERTNMLGMEEGIVLQKREKRDHDSEDFQVARES